MDVDAGEVDNDGEHSSPNLSDRFTVEQFEEGVAFAGVAPSCNLCSADKWFFYTSDKNLRILEWCYDKIDAEDGEKHGLSYYSRSCLNCGNIQTFSRVIVQSAYRRSVGQDED